ncbi:uncharacterized protein LOC115880504 [Sitophilus oryzae]|uniref:Uncharacterized protein LOC115880504 n=1 Tax=Sitophilus oryzae TaxID=7048 RepID=A0A6J2XSI1_SITOR|nr:uncharacterized protein LOC115880504 [Sitophilus oryzae]
MVMCWAPDCKHYSVRETCKFFRFPKDIKKRKKWKKLTSEDTEIEIKTISENPEVLTCVRPETSAGESGEEICPTTSGTTSSAMLEEENYLLRKENDELKLKTSSVLLEAENYFLRKENDDLKAKLKNLSLRFMFDHIKDNEKLVLLYTGLPNSNIFMSLFNLVKDVDINYYYNWKVEKVKRIDQLLLCLMKLRHNFPHADLAHRFGISHSAVSNIVITWIHLLHTILFKQILQNIPNRASLPTCFSTFSNCDKLDCTETSAITCTSCMKRQKITCSSCKHIIWKALIGVAPNGVVTFISDLYVGSTSDDDIVGDCKIPEMLESGDLMLADEGFMPEPLAMARIHVKSAIQRIKCYKILMFLPQQYIQHADALLQVTVALSSLQYLPVN